MITVSNATDALQSPFKSGSHLIHSSDIRQNDLSHILIQQPWRNRYWMCWLSLSDKHKDADGSLSVMGAL